MQLMAFATIYSNVCDANIMPKLFNFFVFNRRFSADWLRRTAEAGKQD